MAADDEDDLTQACHSGPGAQRLHDQPPEQTAHGEKAAVLQDVSGWRLVGGGEDAGDMREGEHAVEEAEDGDRLHEPGADVVQGPVAHQWTEHPAADGARHGAQ